MHNKVNALNGTKVYSLLAGPVQKKCYGQKENSRSKVCHLILSNVYCVIFLI